jgi:hypothetical protein
MEKAAEWVRSQAETGSGLSNEGSLHSTIKEWYGTDNARYEVRVDRCIVDIVRGEHLIEIQTRNFPAIKNKLLRLCKHHTVRLVHPIAVEKWITHVKEQGGEVISKRRSPKRGKLISIFDELVRTPEIINEVNISIEVLMIKMEEIRCADGKGSWRRKGVSIVDRKLIEVVERVEFFNKFDFLKCLPEGLAEPFSNKSLAKSLGIYVASARRITYCLKKMGAIIEVGKRGNELLFETEK